MKDYWKLSLLLSFLLHGLVFIFIFETRERISFSKKKKIKSVEAKAIEVTRNQIKGQLIDEEAPNIEPLAYIDNIMLRLAAPDNNLLTWAKPSASQESSADLTLADAPLDKKITKIPAYANYLRNLRVKIQAKVDRNYFISQNGEVVVIFDLASDGSLVRVGISPESTSDERLRSIALKAIKESSPFLFFPEELKKYPLVRFKIPIEFKAN